MLSSSNAWKMLPYLHNSIYLLYKPSIPHNIIDSIKSHQSEAVIYLLNNIKYNDDYAIYRNIVSLYNNNEVVMEALVNHLGKDYVNLFEYILNVTDIGDPRITDNMWVAGSKHFNLRETLEDWNVYPHLAHYLNEDISAFTWEYEFTDRSLRWFLDRYDKQHIDIVNSAEFNYVSKDLLQELLNIVIRDSKYLPENSDLLNFIWHCIKAKCSLKGCDNIMHLVDGNKLKYRLIDLYP